LSETNDPLAGAISSLKQHRPDASELASLASQLAVRGIPLTVADAAPRGPSLAWKKWALLGGGALSGVGLWLSLRAPSAAPAAVPTPSVPGLVAPSPSPSPSPSPAAAREEMPPQRRLAPPSPPREPAAAEPLREGEAQVLPPPLPIATTSSTSLALAPRDSAIVNEREEVADPPNRPTAPSIRTAPPGTVTRPSLAPDLPSATTGPTEIELLRDARLALRESPARALALVESHAHAFPQGKLTQERELIAISALVALGRRTAALSRASRFEQSFPQSPYRRQIADLLR
jgi:hypothetical protein